ncbi:MAG: DNA-3-methyladenine glycosylase I [Methylococcales bacterium]
MKKTRCYWAINVSPEEVIYHDTEWGLPCYDDAHLFEMLLLEGAQAGLSWSTILHKREGYRLHYDGFNPEKIALWTDDKIEQLMLEPAIIRNRLKINAARTNAQVFLNVLDDYSSFSDYLWQFVDGKPVHNTWETHAEVPAFTEQSELMAKTLHKAGFRFVGKTICYAYMQAVGMVNDHTTDCFRHVECSSFL